MRLHALTGLRFFAAFAVVIYHAGRHIDPDVIRFAALGNTGVTFFFVLSGFVLTWTARGGDKPSHFYWRRFARVWPLHLVTTVLALALMLFWDEEASLLLLVATLLLLHAWLPPNDWHYGYNQVSWSLSAEAFFYLMFPVAAPRLLGRPARARAALVAIPSVMVLAAVAVLIAMPGRAGFLLYVNPAYRFGEFLIGVAIAVLIRSGWRPRLSLRAAGIAVAGSYVAGTVLAHMGWGDPLRMPTVIGDTVMLPSLALLICAAAVRELDGGSTWLGAPAIVRLGEWSFALYLVHDLLLRAAARHAIEWLPAPLLIALVVAAAVLLSGVFHVWIERPVERYLRRQIRATDSHVQAKPTSVSVG